jgi:hypothetical protein
MENKRRKGKERPVAKKNQSLHWLMGERGRVEDEYDWGRDKIYRGPRFHVIEYKLG